MVSVHSLGNFARAVAREAGEITTRAFRHTGVVRAKGPGDFVTETDLAVESHVSAAIAREFPEHGLVSEESAAKDSDAEYVWILDPIDGTRYFISGVPLYSVSLALRHRTEMVLGVVFNPETGEIFSAVRGEGATRNGDAIHCSTRPSLAESMVCLEIPHRHFPKATVDRAVKRFHELVAMADRVRILGVSALGLCYCAAGGFDAYVNLSGASKIWDLAAGQMILREAGGRFTTTQEGYHIGGPPALHDELLQWLS